MNAFLSVSLLKLPVTSLEEVHKMKYDLLIWKNSVIEDYIRYACVYECTKLVQNVFQSLEVFPVLF